MSSFDSLAATSVPPKHCHTELDALQHGALHAPCAEFMARSGKRIREVAVQMSYRLAGGQGAAPSCLAESIERLHAGSLIIDDIQDDSASRREHPAMHREIGVPLAINAGNWMYFQALACLADAALPARLRQRLVRAMLQAGLRCHEGQALDLSADVCRLPIDSWHEAARRISRLKTGSLVALAMSMGAIAAGAPRPVRRSLARFGMNLGIALQMRNDLEEVRRLATPPLQSLQSRHAAKHVARSDDFAHRRVTWVWGWAALHCSDRARVLATRLKAGDEATYAGIAAELDDRIGGYADCVIASRVDRHLRLLGEHIVDGPAIEQLRSSLSVIIESQLASETHL